jgi:ammonia channel protein AmtB
MKLFSMVAQIAGLVVITAGVSLVFVPAGLIVGGACLVLVGFAFGMSKE